MPGQPRRAGVSSFGFGGVNAHVVLEEGPAAAPRTSPARGEASVRALGQDRRSAARAGRARSRPCWRANFAGERGEQSYLADLAFTLRRKTPLAHRLAVVAASASELAAHLRAWPEGAPDVASGIAQAGAHEAMGLFASEADLEERLRALVAAGELHKLAALWVKGFAIEWDRILPRGRSASGDDSGYPFARESFWVTFGQADTQIAAPRPLPHAHPRLLPHPQSWPCTPKAGWRGRSARAIRASRKRRTRANQAR